MGRVRNNNVLRRVEEDAGLDHLVPKRVLTDEEFAEVARTDVWKEEMKRINDRIGQLCPNIG